MNRFGVARDTHTHRRFLYYPCSDFVKVIGHTSSSINTYRHACSSERKCGVRTGLVNNKLFVAPVFRYRVREVQERPQVTVVCVPLVSRDLGSCVALGSGMNGRTPRILVGTFKARQL
jgi:hypothetical protein